MRRRFSARILGALLVMLPLTVPLPAQVPGPGHAWRWAAFGTAEGLPAPGITSIAEAADGTIWVATDAGLAWFDGFVWHPMGVESGIPSRPGGILVAGRDHRIFAIIHNQLHVGDTAGFTRVPLTMDVHLLDSTRASRVVEHVVTAVAPLGPDDLLVLLVLGNDEATNGRALVRLRGGEVSVVEMPARLDRTSGLFALRSGVVVLAAAGRLYRWTDGGWWPGAVIQGATGVSGLAGNAHGEVIGSVANLLDGWGVFEGTAESVHRAVGEGTMHVRAADIGASGAAAVVYATGRVRIREDGRWSDMAHAPPFLGGSTRSVLFARDGDIWFGTERGLLLYRATARRWTSRSFPFPDRRAIVNALVVSRAGQVWTGTEDGIVVYRMDREVPEWIRTVDGRPLGAITGLAEDADGAIWATSGLSFEGAFRWDGRTWRHFGAAEGLTAPRVHAVVVDRTGAPWFLGIGMPGDHISGPGAFRYADGRFERWGEAEGLPSGRVYAFADDADGARWFGTREGVSRWRAGTWTHWPVWRTTLPSGRHVSAPLRPWKLLEFDGRMWIADRSVGIGAIDAQDSLTVWGRRDGLTSTEVHDLAGDADGTLWASTSRGLCSYRDGMGQWWCIGPSVGLAAENVWPIAVTPQGIYIGTLGEGLQILSRAEASDPSPRVTFEPPIARGRDVEVRWSVQAWEGALTGEALGTRFRVDQGPWSPWSPERVAYLDGYRPGRHAVEVQARGIFVPRGERTATLEIVVPRPFVLRPAFAVPVGLLLTLLGIVGVVTWRHRRRTVIELRSSEARFRSLGEAAFEGIGFLGEGDVLEVNERLAEMLGYRSEEMIGASLDGLVADRSRALLHEMQQLMRRKRPDEPAVQFELWARRKDGSEFPAEIQTKAMPLGGHVVRVVAVRDVTERFAAEQARQRSEEKFAKAFWASPDAIDIAREADGSFVEVNEALVELYGRPRDQMIGRTGAELGLWADDGDRERYWAQVRRDGRVRGFETRLRTATGSVRDCLISAERIEIGGEACVIALTRDVTEQRRTVDALRLTQFSVDHAGDAILWVDVEGRIGYANDAAVAVLEGRRTPLVGTAIGSVDDRWAGPAWREFWQVVKRHGATIRAGTWRARTGHTFPVEVLCNHLAAGGREYMVVSGRDISERVAAEQALLASQAKFATAFRSSPNGMAILRAADGVVLEANDELLRLLGLPRARVIGRPAAQSALWPDEQAWQDFRDCVVAGACEHVTDVRLGERTAERVALLSAEPLELAGERCLLCVLQDVTEREQAREAVEESRKALRVLSRQLMAAQESERARISRELHDEIGQTLAAVKLNLQAIGRFSDDERVGAQVRDGIAVVDATVVEVRNLSRELRPSVLDDLGLAAALKWYLARQAERSNLAITFDPDPGLPRAHPSVETACYRIVQEALTNILRHAEATRVEVEVNMEGVDMVLTVRDDGRGFDPADLVHRPATEAHLGLVGMRERAENASGVLVVESAPGAGTVIRARFRRAGTDAAPGDARAASASIR